MSMMKGGRLSPGPTTRWLLAALLFLAPEARAEDPAPGLTVHQIARLQWVDEVAISPDGSAVAYVLESPKDLTKDEDGPAWL